MFNYLIAVGLGSIICTILIMYMYVEIVWEVMQDKGYVVEKATRTSIIKKYMMIRKFL